MVRGKGGEKRDGGVQSVDRALTLLEILGSEEEGLRLTDLSMKSGLSPSTAHRLLTTLEKRRFVQFDAADNHWHVGRAAFSVGASFVKRRNFVAPSLHYLKYLRDLTRETANLGVIEDGSVITLAQAESREIMRAIAPVGGRAPVTSSAMGKAIMATWTAKELETFINRHPLMRLTSASIMSFEALKAELEEVRQNGYAIDNEEYMPGLRCVGAAVYNHQGEAFFAISVSGLTSRVSMEKVAEMGLSVARTAGELTRALGGVMPQEISLTEAKK